MFVLLQSYVIILGVLLEISGVLMTLSNHFTSELYDESGFWFGPNDNKIVNEFRNQLFSRVGTYFILFGVFIQLTTLLYADVIILTEATLVKVLLLTILLFLIVGISNFIAIRITNKVIYRKIVKHISSKLKMIGKSNSRLHYLDGVRYIKYLDKEFIDSGSEEEVRKHIKQLYGYDEIFEIEIHGVDSIDSKPKSPTN